MKKNISVFIVIVIVFSFIVPTYAMDNQIMIRLPENKQEITTKHIERIDVESINQLNEKKMFNIVLELVDYRGRVLNYITSEEILEGKESSKIKGYTKILPKGYKIKVFACDNLNDRNTISNIVEIPIKNGYFVEEIVSIDELNIEIPQWSEYRLPKEVPAKMNTGSTKNVPVKWNVDSVDTTKSGKFVIEGNVIGYKGQKVILNLNINQVEKIVSVEDLYIVIDQGDAFNLPSTVLATMSSGAKSNVPVKWNVDTIDTNTVGEYIFEGEVQGYSNKIKLNLTIQELDLSEIVRFENTEIEEIIREEIGKKDGSIFKSDLLKITNLNLQWALYGDLNINDLRHLKNLETLDLGFYEYNFDLTPISNLPKLKSLNLFNNAIDDITPLQMLTSLSELNLAKNKVTSIESLRNLTSLTKLQLNENQINDVRPLYNLVNLTDLKLSGNQITDYSPTIIYYDNLISKDFELVILKADEENIISYNLNLGGKVVLPYGVKLSTGEIVFVNWDKEEIIGSNSGVERVKGEIVGSQGEIYFQCTIGEVEEDRIIEFPDKGLEKSVRMAIDKEKGDIYYSDVKSLRELNVMAVGVWDLTGIENFKGLEKLCLWGNNIESSQLKHLKGLSNLKSLDLALNRLTFIPANAFENMSKLEELVLDENQITEIDKEAFNGLINLKDLLIEENRISNIDAVRGLESLENLLIRYNNISDISPVENLTNISNFWANNNKISDISPLANLTELNWVHLEENNISDISSLGNSKKIARLNISDNAIKNIDVVSNMPNLEWLEAGNNQIENIDCVSELVGLSILNLKNNKITNIEALRKLEKLTQLYLAGNNITDFSPVAGFYEKIKKKDFNLN